MIGITKAQSALTHYDSKASDACVFYNTLVVRYMSGESKLPVIRETITKYPVYQGALQLGKEELNLQVLLLILSYHLYGALLISTLLKMQCARLLI